MINQIVYKQTVKNITELFLEPAQTNAADEKRIVKTAEELSGIISRTHYSKYNIQ
jgi:hypothetical protein